MIEDIKKEKRNFAKLEVTGMANPLYNKIISTLNENGRKIRNFEKEQYTDIYSLEDHTIKIHYDRMMDKLEILVLGSHSSQIIQKLNSLDPTPF